MLSVTAFEGTFELTNEDKYDGIPYIYEGTYLYTKAVKANEGFRTAPLSKLLGAALIALTRGPSS